MPGNGSIWIRRKSSKEFNQYSLIYLIIERDWQGALSLILNDINRFHLHYMDIIEAGILNKKLNLVLRLLQRLKEKFVFNETNSSQQNFYHLLANMNEYDENLFKQIFLFLANWKFDWNKSDQNNCYPLHYAYVKRNFRFIELFKEKYPKLFHTTPKDNFQNTLIGLLFWSLGHKTNFSNEKLRLLISSGKELDCLCNYENENLINPLSFNYTPSLIDEIPYPPVKSNNLRTSPLIHAIVHNNFPLAQFLIELNADINFPDENHQTPLMHAIRQVNSSELIFSHLVYL